MPAETSTAHAPERVARRLRDVLADEATAGRVLDVHLQPIVALPAVVVTEVEALVRWCDEELGTVPADVLVRVAEHHHLVDRLGRWVLRRACTVAAALPEVSGRPPPAVAVNVSPVQLEDRGFVDDVAECLAATGLPGHRLVLEVTESAGVDDLGVTHRVLSGVRRLGVRTALDDFGTGRTSLTLLRDLPLDLVKIDRSFVSGSRRGPSDGVLLRLLVDACHALGLQVVAEGVEDLCQARTVTALGVDRGQGWFFGRPMPPGQTLDAAVGAVEAPAAALTSPVTATPDEFVLVSATDHTVVFASSAVFDVLGYLPAELAGRDLSSFVLPDDTHLLSDPGDPRTVPGERLLRIRHRDGGLRYVRARSDVVEDVDLGPRVVSLCRDVTPVELARRSARQAEDMLERAFDEAPCGMSLTDLDGRIRTVNRALAALYGRAPDDLVGRHIDELTHPEDRGADERNLRAQRAGEVERVHVHKRAVRPDGAVVPTEVVASLVRDADGLPAVIVAHVVALEP